MPNRSVRVGTWLVELTCHNQTYRYNAPIKGQALTCGTCGLPAIVERVMPIESQRRGADK